MVEQPTNNIVSKYFFEEDAQDLANFQNKNRVWQENGGIPKFCGIIKEIKCTKTQHLQHQPSPIPRMKVNVVLSDLNNPYFIVDEYSKEELEGIWKEIDFLTDFKKFQLDDEQLLSINLDDSYNNKNISNILSYRYKEKLELFVNQVDRPFPEVLLKTL